LVTANVNIHDLAPSGFAETFYCNNVTK
jgi:hypothetical protein